MLDYNEITEHKYIVLDNEPWEVISSHVFRKQQRKPVNATKLRNLLTGRVTERSFHQSEKVSEAEISTKPVKYLYTNRGESWFCEVDKPSQRFTLDQNILGPGMKFIKENSVIDAVEFADCIISIKLPIKVELKVIEAAPAVKGNTAQGAVKEVKLETGVSVNTPLFINEGDVIRVNTDSGQYAERVSN